MKDHIILRDTHDIGYIDVTLGFVDWGKTIHNVKRPYDMLIVDGDYVLPNDVEVLLKNFADPIISVNHYQYGQLIADDIWLYYSPSIGIIFQIQGNYFGFNKNAYVYS